MDTPVLRNDSCVREHKAPMAGDVCSVLGCGGAAWTKAEPSQSQTALMGHALLRQPRWLPVLSRGLLLNVPKTLKSITQLLDALRQKVLTKSQERNQEHGAPWLAMVAGGSGARIWHMALQGHVERWI